MTISVDQIDSCLMRDETSYDKIQAIIDSHIKIIDKVSHIRKKNFGIYNSPNIEKCR